MIVKMLTFTIIITIIIITIIVIIIIVQVPHCGAEQHQPRDPDGAAPA